MRYCILLLLLCIAFCRYFFLKMKKEKYALAVNKALMQFDDFLTAVYIEQVNNKILTSYGYDIDKDIKPEFISILSAKSFIKSVCVSVFVSVDGGEYGTKNERYILKIIRNNKKFMDKMYENYMATVPKIRIIKELYIYSGIDVIDMVSRERFARLMDEMIAGTVR